MGLGEKWYEFEEDQEQTKQELIATEFSSVDEGVLCCFSTLSSFPLSRVIRNSATLSINLPTESTMGSSSISIANSPMYNEML